MPPNAASRRTTGVDPVPESSRWPDPDTDLRPLSSPGKLAAAKMLSSMKRSLCSALLACSAVAGLGLVVDGRPAQAGCYLTAAQATGQNCDIINGNQGTNITYSFGDPQFALGNVAIINFKMNNINPANFPFTIKNIQFSREIGGTRTWYDYGSPAELTLTSSGTLTSSPLVIDLRDPAYGGIGANGTTGTGSNGNSLAQNKTAGTDINGNPGQGVNAFQIRAYIPVMKAPFDSDPTQQTNDIVMQVSTYVYATSGQPCRYPNVCGVTNNPQTQTRTIEMIVPGPLPIFGASVGFAFSRRLRRRIAAAKA